MIRCELKLFLVIFSLVLAHHIFHKKNERKKFSVLKSRRSVARDFDILRCQVVLSL